MFSVMAHCSSLCCFKLQWPLGLSWWQSCDVSVS